jgi:hypothetical protein
MTSADAYSANVALLKEVATASKSFNAQMTLVSSAVDEAASVLGAELAPVLLDLAVQFRDFLLAAKDSGALKVFAENAAAAFKVLIGILKLAGIALAGLAFVKVRAGIIALGAAFVKAKNAVLPVLVGFRNVARIAPILATRLIAVEVAMGALALVGGPLGAILLAVGAGLAFMANESGKTRDKVAELNEEFKKLRGEEFKKLRGELEKAGKTPLQINTISIDTAQKRLEGLIAARERIQKDLGDLKAGIAVDTTLDIKTQTDTAERNIINLSKRINELVKKIKELKAERFALVGPKAKPDAPDVPGLPDLETAGGAGDGARDRQLKQIQDVIDALTLEQTALRETAAVQGQGEEALRRLNAELEIHETLVGLGLVDAHGTLAKTIELVNSGANTQASAIAKLITENHGLQFAIGGTVEAEGDLTKSQEELIASFKRLEAELDPVNAAISEHAARMGELIDLHTAGIIPSKERLNELLELERERWNNVKQSMEGTEETAKRTNDVARQLGFTFSSAFEDAIVEGKGLRDVLQGLEQDILRILTRALITEPLARGITGIIGSLPGLGGIFGADGGSVQAGAGGGRISGPGGPKSDAIPARLSDGEFVVNAAATKQNLALLEAINAGIPRLADGGLVSAPINNIAAAPASRFADAPSRFGGERPIMVNVTNHIAPGATQSDFRAATMDQASRFGRVMQRAMAENE